MKKIRDWFFHNLGWKLVSFVLAFILWFICLNVNNPVDTWPFTLNLQLENLSRISDDYIIMNKEELENLTITLRVQTTTNALNELTRQLNRNFRTYIDLEPVNLYQDLGEFQSVAIEIEVPLEDTEYTIKYQSLRKIDVMIDRNITREFTMQVDRLGEPSEGYIAGKIEMDPEVIQISGAETILDTIDSVHVQVDMSAAVNNVSADATPIVYDKDGNDITSLVQLDTSSVFINVPISKYNVVNIDIPRITGNVAEGYLVTNVYKSVDYLEIVGTSDEIAKVSSITLPAINVSNAIENQVVDFDLRNHLGDAAVEIRNQTPSEVTITVEIQKEEVRELQIPVERLQIIGMSSNFSLPPDDIQLTIRGAEVAVSDAVEKGLYGTLDLTELSAGTHEVAVQFSLPDNVSQVGESVITIEIEGDQGLTPTEEAPEGNAEATEGVGDEEENSVNADATDDAVDDLQ